MNAVLLDVLCVGHASWDLVFEVPRHPNPDEKLFAEALVTCGGGPAANAAVTVARLGLASGFLGVLGADAFGDLHLKELNCEGVNTHMVLRNGSTAVSSVLVKPGGDRALVTARGRIEEPLSATMDPARIQATVYLFDGHEARLSAPFIGRQCPTVLDAGSLHAGTRALMGQVEHLVCSEKFAREWLGEDRPDEALRQLSDIAPVVVITLGQRGLIWQRDGQQGSLGAFSVRAVDTTGAGDAFHGAYAAALVMDLPWLEVLRFASAAGALATTCMGARPALPGKGAVEALLRSGKCMGLNEDSASPIGARG